MMRTIFSAVLTAALAAPAAENSPKMLAYSAAPNAYFDDHAADAARLYDGFFFVVGSWDEGVSRCLGVGEQPPSDPSWREKVKSNITRLREADATESLLGVSFGESEPWPSAETLLSAEFTAKMASHFAAAGRAAKDLGFRGVSIDLEYPYKRYALDHPSYMYDTYTADDLMAGARDQGRACMSAVLDAFPDAVIFLLPGELGGSPIERAFTRAMLDVMAERDAPGGLHLGYERSYCLLDPASQTAIPRVGDCAAEAELEGNALAYWKRRCTTAPGVWPLHMVETGGPDYPVRPWPDELAELRHQLGTLRAVAKRYIWSFSGNPVWLPADAALRQKYGLPPVTFEGAAEAISGWHDILTSEISINDARLRDLIGAVHDFDAGRLDAAGLCARFATPPAWMVLGYLGNPFTAPAFSAQAAATGPIDFAAPVHGRDGVVRWFPFSNYEPTGHIRLRAAFDYRATDKCSVHLVCTMTAADDVEGNMLANFDDGGLLRLDDQVIMDNLAYPERGHGLLYKDRYLFEYAVPIKITKGSHRLALTSVNSHGSWGMNLRFVDAEGYPLKGLSFSLP